MKKFLSCSWEMVQCLSVTVVLVYSIAWALSPPPNPKPTHNFWEQRMKETIYDGAGTVPVTYTIKSQEATREEIILYISDKWIQSIKERAVDL